MDSFLGLFAAAGCAPHPTFFGLKAWNAYLPYAYDSATGKCEVVFNTLGNGHNSSFLLILVAIVDDLLILAGLIAVIFVIYAGIKYVMSQGSPDETAKAQSTLINAVLGLAIALIGVALVSYLGSHLAGPLGKTTGSGIDASSLPHTTAGNATVKLVLGIVFSVVGALALLFITIGGFRYVLSQGDPQATSKAKNTILYALVGLVVAIVAQVIVTFVIGRL
ncbi:MAG: hypothetical protein ABIR37_02725 [Candidatus Saccharimonadales bacterium]